MIIQTRLFLPFLAFAISAAPVLADGNPEAGKTIFARCSACHAPTAQNKIGPGLQGVVGRAAGTASGYSYSTALKGSGLTWDEATLDTFLKAPGKLVKGTRMVTALPKDQERADVISYLKTLLAQ